MDNDKLVEELDFKRDFYTDLEHIMMSISHTRECFLRLSTDYLEGSI